ncbi:MAG: BON domain-containing protein [Pirellulales bacterium]
MAFEYPRPAPARLTAVLERRLTRMEPFSSVDLRVEGGAAVLRGQVATEDDRLLAENLVRLEPGVSAIRNEITIAGISRAPATEAGGSAAQARVP